jgi:hypothetical protein
MNASGHSTGNPVSSAVSAVHACTRMLSPFSPRATCPSQLLRVCHTTRIGCGSVHTCCGSVRYAGPADAGYHSSACMQAQALVRVCPAHLAECARHTHRLGRVCPARAWQSVRVCPVHALGRVCPAHAPALVRVCPTHAQSLGRVCSVQAQALGRVCPASAKPRFCPILTPSQHPNRFSRSCLREHGDRHRVTMAVPRTACTVRTGCTPQARRVPLSRSTRRRRRTQSRRVPLSRSTRTSRRA